MSEVGRYTNRKITVNEDNMYKTLFNNREIKKITHHKTTQLTYPTPEQIQNLEMVNIVWKVGDSYPKLASEYYGNPKLWWVIGWFNKKPTETEVKYGDIISVPFPLERVVSYYNL